MITNEFSICLKPDQQTTASIMHLRSQLPPSPYRDDEPHLTLLRGITAPGPDSISDESLLAQVGQALGAPADVSLEVPVWDVMNGNSLLYSRTGALLLHPVQPLLDLRSSASNNLQKVGFAVKEEERKTYLPHVTVRLGIPLEDHLLERARTLFRPQADIAFNGWFLLRIIDDDGARLARQLEP